jgi:hypothetical protein
MICPKCDYERQATDSAPVAECPRCGVVYAKWRVRAEALAADPIPRDNYAAWPEPAPEAEVPAAGLARRIASRLVAVKPSVTPIEFWGHAIVYVALFVWGWYFIRADYYTGEAMMRSFMHNVDLVFHEAGHFIFRPLGDFMMVLGGSLMQLLIPLVVALAFFLKNRDNFGAAVGVWWLGQSFVDLSPYIYDASRLVLPLLGGGTGIDRPGYHDWHNILSRLGLLTSDWLIAKWVDRLGIFLILVFMVWGGVVLFRESRNLGADSYE